MKVGDSVFFVPDRAPIRDAKTLTVEHVGVKHFMAPPYTFRIAEGGPMLGRHSSGSVWPSKDAYDRHTRSQLAWRKLRNHVSGANPIPDGVTLEDLEAALKLLRIK
jgi:hypothetical protein